MTLNQWAIKYGVPHGAVAELRAIFGTYEFEPSPLAGESEAAVQTRIRLEASKKGMRLWRNNVGATPAEETHTCPRCSTRFNVTKQPVRYGLANESPKMNKTIKSHDLIGIHPVLIQPHHVGQVIGQFVSREVKKGSWVYTGTEHEKAQLKWGELINSMGGDAAFANREGTI